MTHQEEIRSLLDAFQAGYIRRDVSQLEPFMELFTADAEVLGTNGVKPGLDEWCTSREMARGLVKGDWETWGDLRLDLDSASIRIRDQVGWIAATATVTQTIGAENYAYFLKSIQDFLDSSPLLPEQKLHYILRVGSNTVYELQLGEKFVWPLRLTAVVVREAAGWKFAQLNFSFPTIYFPDVRITDQT